MNYRETRKLMFNWAREAGNRILEVLQSADLETAHKSLNVLDIVTKADRVSEEFLRQQIVRYFPTHNIRGEEEIARENK